jgi:hypothetical protein
MPGTVPQVPHQYPQVSPVLPLCPPLGPGLKAWQASLSANTLFPLQPCTFAGNPDSPGISSP